MHYAVCQGDVAYDDAGPVDSCTVCVATDVQHLAVEGEQVIAIDQSRHEPRTANDVAPQNVCALLLHHNRNKFWNKQNKNDEYLPRQKGSIRLVKRPARDRRQVKKRSKTQSLRF